MHEDLSWKLQTQFAIASDLSLIEEENFLRIETESQEALRALNGLIGSLKVSNS